MSAPLDTLALRCRHLQEIRKSRFLALAAPAESTAQAMAFLKDVSDPSATHNCWAYRMGDNYRFNDDGEPSGTAGRPILQAIEGQEMDRVIVVITRWYGGINLGAGGLMRAYGGTAAECLRRAERLPIIVMANLGLHCDFAELTMLKARLRDWQADIRSEIFDADGVQLQLQLPESRVAEAQTRITDISRGRSKAVRLD